MATIAPTAPFTHLKEIQLKTRIRIASGLAVALMLAGGATACGSSSKPATTTAKTTATTAKAGDTATTKAGETTTIKAGETTTTAKK